MAKVITFSRYFPGHHPRKGEQTHFVEKIWNSIAYLPEIYLEQFPIPYEQLGIDFSKVKDTKGHTIRAGNRFKEGDWFSPRVWSGKPYNSKQITFAPDIQIKKVWNMQIIDIGGVDCIRLNGEPFGQFHPLAKGCQDIAKNDGLTAIELIQWFSNPRPHGDYQIICWSQEIEY